MRCKLILCIVVFFSLGECYHDEPLNKEDTTPLNDLGNTNMLPGKQQMGIEIL